MSDGGALNPSSVTVTTDRLRATMVGVPHTKMVPMPTIFRAATRTSSTLAFLGNATCVKEIDHGAEPLVSTIASMIQHSNGQEEETHPIVCRPHLDIAAGAGYDDEADFLWR